MAKHRKVQIEKEVSLLITVTGIKVCSPDGKEVLMAHGLRRVSYATCDPGCKQFCFLARQPGGHINKQYCHLFVTKTAEQPRGNDERDNNLLTTNNSIVGFHNKESIKRNVSIEWKPQGVPLRPFKNPKKIDTKEEDLKKLRVTNITDVFQDRER
ncbi:PTB/PI domain,PH domain-like [Cinara cedri]|uniref:PTB/PI domain,PH domain-like n=1 Tax=Cinara cedri TaxID=506608 RepID=A0A5E4MUS5_9HEMI|nr:PTB/PI domain,PH domain-like [Cinara cedri]